MERLIDQIEQAIVRYQRFTNNYLIFDLIQKLEAYKTQLLNISQ